MMRPDAKVQKVYLYPKPVDFRKSINGLAALVELDIKVEVFNPVLFVFLNRTRSQVKILYWERNGFCLWLIRRSSPTFGQWVGAHLSAENKCQLWIPPGFAHGFVTLSETAEFLYKTTDYYAPQSERCIAWNDASLDIEWPYEDIPRLSGKDAQGVLLSSAELFY